MGEKQPGYLLPTGELGNDEIVCQLVYLPDRDEYWRALLGSLTYFTTWKAWERDEDKRGKDAAANWDEAFELTLECWRMACLEDITSRLDLIISLMGNQLCCDTTIVNWEVTTIVTTTITPGVGDDPDYYGETAVADWDEWYEHLCFQAHAYVDSLVKYAESIASIFDSSALTLERFAQMLSSFWFVGLPIPFYVVDAIEWFAAFIDGVGEDTFETAAADIEETRSSIVCAIVSGNSLSDAIEDALSEPLAWSLFFGLINYDSVTAILTEGGYDDDYLPTGTSEECCEAILVYAVGGSGSQCATYDKDGAYRIPSSGYASSYTAYQHTHGCNDLGYAGTVLRLRFSDNADAVTGRSVRVWVTDYDLTGGIGGAYPNALEFYNPSVGLIQAITHANFVEGASYTDDNVAYIIVMAGELGGATLNWEFTN